MALPPVRDAADAERPAPGADDHADAGSVLELDGAAAHIAGRTIWRDLQLTVRAGEFVAVLGPNGAGKSTLLKVILGSLPLSAGRVRVLGAPARRGNPAIAYLPQRRSFDADVRIRGRDLVRLGLDGARWGIPVPWLRRLLGGGVQVRDEEQRVQVALETVGATAYADRPIGEVSGGEQQRLLIAQALITRPRLLLLDEPFESLDLAHQQSIAALIHRVGRAHGISVLLVAHDVNPILPYLDRVLYVARGHTAAGTPAAIMTSETLSQLYGAPVEVLRAGDGRIVVVGQPEGDLSHAVPGH
ncbi:MAG TPA: metal ABC transporter ATP-binding protein [Chloroflexota bacterium]